MCMGTYRAHAHTEGPVSVDIAIDMAKYLSYDI